MAKSKKPFPPGTLVQHTPKFRRIIGSVTRGPVDGIVLGSGSLGNLVAWSDGHTVIINVVNIQKTRRQLGEAQAKATVAAEVARLPQTMADSAYSPEDIEEIKREYGIVGNPSKKKKKTKKKAKKKAKKKSVKKKAKKKTKKIRWVQDDTGIYVAEGTFIHAGQSGELVVYRSPKGWDAVFEPWRPGGSIGMPIVFGSAKTLTEGKRMAEKAIAAKANPDDDAYYIVNTRTGLVEAGPFTSDEADAIKHVRFDRNYKVMRGEHISSVAFEAANPRGNFSLMPPLHVGGEWVDVTTEGMRHREAARKRKTKLVGDYSPPRFNPEVKKLKTRLLK